MYLTSSSTSTADRVEALRTAFLESLILRCRGTTHIHTTTVVEEIERASGILRDR